MADIELYGWDKVRAFHTVSLNQMEQGRASWDNQEATLRLRRALVWHPAATVTMVPTTSAPLPQKM